MKGRYPQQELETIERLVKNVTVKQLFVPDLQAERYLVKIQGRLSL